MATALAAAPLEAHAPDARGVADRGEAVREAASVLAWTPPQVRYRRPNVATDWLSERAFERQRAEPAKRSAETETRRRSRSGASAGVLLWALCGDADS